MAWIRRWRRTIRCRRKYGAGNCPHVERHSRGHPDPVRRVKPVAPRHRADEAGSAADDEPPAGPGGAEPAQP